MRGLFRREARAGRQGRLQCAELQRNRLRRRGGGRGGAGFVRWGIAHRVSGGDWCLTTAPPCAARGECASSYWSAECPYWTGSSQLTVEQRVMGSAEDPQKLRSG